MVPAGGAGGACRGGGSLGEQAGDRERAREREDVVVFHDVYLLWGRMGIGARAHACAFSSADWSDWTKARLVSVAPETIWIFEF